MYVNIMLYFSLLRINLKIQGYINYLFFVVFLLIIVMGNY